MKTSTSTTNDMFKAHFHFATFPALGKNFFRLLMRWRSILESIHENLSPKKQLKQPYQPRSFSQQIHLHYKQKNIHKANKGKIALMLQQ